MSCRVVLAEIVCGLEHIHSQNVVYNDLKPENVLIHESGHIKLTDFGAARFLTKEFASDPANARVEGTKVSCGLICSVSRTVLLIMQCSHRLSALHVRYTTNGP